MEDPGVSVGQEFWAWPASSPWAAKSGCARLQMVSSPPSLEAQPMCASQMEGGVKYVRGSAGAPERMVRAPGPLFPLGLGWGWPREDTLQLPGPAMQHRGTFPLSSSSSPKRSLSSLKDMHLLWALRSG